MKGVRIAGMTRDELIEMAWRGRVVRPIAIGVARGSSSLETEDLEGEGWLGVIEAAGKWDGRGEFLDYCRRVVRWRLKDYCRTVDVLGRDDRRKVKRGERAGVSHVAIYKDGKALVIKDQRGTSWVGVSEMRVDLEGMVGRGVFSEREVEYLAATALGVERRKLAEAMGVCESRIAQLHVAVCRKVKAETGC